VVGSLPLLIGIWGDSHLAAAFFTQELQRLSKLPAEQMRSRFVPASMNRPGVRLPLRKSCLGPNWEYEPAHAVAMGAFQPGPGLVNLSTRHDGAWLSLDIRNALGQPDKKSLRFLYQQTAEPILLAIRVDDGAEQRVELRGPAGPAKLDLVSDEPLSTVDVRVIQGPLRLHGLEWAVPSDVRLQMDVFGYPGATVAGWRQVDAAGLLPWREPSAYDVVVLAFGTNEGNVQPFDAVAYTHMLQAAVASLRQAFPGATCLLIAPGDRGVLVPRSSKPGAKGADKALPWRAPDLLRFTRVHAEIGRVQKQVARAQGCHFWSMFDAMGGAGGAYRWARQNPPLMARDLIHFTVPGYQRLAQLMAQDLGWSADLFQSGR
jgi:lysophospholipase L1-like esterase